jgi:stage III sporulation protein AG
MDKGDFKKEINKILGQKTFRNLITICLILAFILVAMNVLTSNNKNSINNNQKDTVATADNTDEAKLNSKDESGYEEKQETDLKNILKNMDGVGDVEVMMSFENGEEKVPAYDKNVQKSTTEETDTEGGKRINNQDTDSSKIVMSTSNGNNEPFILKTYKPKIIGVIILAEGAGNSKIKYEIEQAVSKLYNLSSDKVNVYSMKK